MTRLTRRNFLAASAVGLTTSVTATSLRAANANDEINVGFISCGGRAQGLMKQFSAVPGVNIAGLCDVDETLLAAAKLRFPKAEGWTDLRELIAAPGIDAVVVATCNHWHCLAAIWAMEGGKDVYVEKPLSHSQWEGRQTVAAARKYNKVCQVGTQQRSDPMQAQIKQFLHQEKGIGQLQSARVNRYGIRPSIGRRDKPLEIGKQIAYDLWLGPAQDEPIYRDKLHYDWHWDWNTGSGEMGNWGVHVLDDVRNNVFQDSVGIPNRIMGGGGRVALNDAGETPNVHFAYFDTGQIPVVIGLSNLPAKPNLKGKNAVAPHPGPNSGYVVYGDGGRYEGSRGRGTAYDKQGKVIKKFSGNSGNVVHQANFIEAVRKQDRSILNTEVAIGNDSTGWCNLANIAFQAGSEFTADQAAKLELDRWQEVVREMDDHLKAHNIAIESDAIQLSPILELDTKTEQFVGDSGEQANQYLKRQYRPGYEVPELV